MDWLQIAIFGILLIVGFGFFTMRILQIRKNILLGRDLDRTDNKAERWRTMLLVAFGQKKMFSNPIPALLHTAIYAAFVVTQIELIEIVVDGITGNHRIFMPYLGGFYTFIISFIEILSVLAFVATIAFLARRNMLKVPRLVKSELNGWPKLDANLILIFEIMLISFIMMMNGGDEVLFNRGLTHAPGFEGQEGSFGFAISQHLGPLLFGGMSDGALMAVERIGWWGHILMVFLFLNYLPYSKHFHVVLAFPNVYYSNLEQKGRFTNMEAVTTEVKLMLDPTADPYTAPSDPNATPQRFGAKDVQDLTWKNLLDAYSCTECGRCTAACPANQTGKLLSPRKIMMDTRDRLEEVGNNIKKHGADYNDGKALFGNYITDEEIWACTSCNACVQECPVNIDPLNIIMELRRYSVMEESKMPTELTGMLTNIENNGAPWQFSQADRLKWKDEA
jgi:heterodisulfide reductase subunit C